ncbi:MAG: glutamate-5-semialdehyde dehydrogenase [Gemmataceae bacterium]
MHPDPVKIQEKNATPGHDENLAESCKSMAIKAREASRALAMTATAQKNAWLLQTASLLDLRVQEILEANALDLSQAGASGVGKAAMDRLKLTPERIRSAAAGLREVATLPDPVGRILESRKRPNGLEIHKVGVPLGVIFFIYESRPNVTLDAAGLCVKSGNALILRGGKEALYSNKALHRIVQESLLECALPLDAIQLVTTPDRAAVGHLLQMKDWIDLVIPRGGAELISRVAQEARMPVLKHFQGNCHLYVDRNADLKMTERLVINGKCQRPGVCNALESLLVHQEIAAAFLPTVAAALSAQGVEIRGCSTTQKLAPGVVPATEADYAAEYLDLILSIKVVADLDEAIDHINRFGSAHTDGIITNDLQAARHFTAAVDSAAVMVNASTRFNDGHELGLGAEIGISTDKFHARGPCGLQELCSYKYVVYGEGQVRDG